MRTVTGCVMMGLALAGVLTWGCTRHDAVPKESSKEPSSAAVTPAPSDRSPLIVFSSDRSGPWRLWTIQPDGTGMKQLTQGGPDDADVDPAFSPDGGSILFTSTRGGSAGIWRMTIASGKMERVCDGDQAGWSPDGKSIVFRRTERIFRRDLAGGAEKALSPESWPHCSGPAWSPKGGEIAFACRWEAGNGVYVMAAEGGEPRKVFGEQGACQPHWSPDGAKIVYETETNLCTINPDGTHNRTVTYYGGVQRLARWSPDGSRLVFCQAASPDGPWELYTVPAQGGEPTRLTEGGSDMYPDWK